MQLCLIPQIHPLSQSALKALLYRSSHLFVNLLCSSLLATIVGAIVLISHLHRDLILTPLYEMNEAFTRADFVLRCRKRQCCVAIGIKQSCNIDVVLSALKVSGEGLNVALRAATDQVKDRPGILVI